ncbi:MULTISPECIES: hypothetical protein [Microbacterium]|uniref:Uncharacterized protein n=1 Tax=Microbacterium trichothecenolyticum TaxID=69370 RepID=A0A0M2HAG3_MICTR|nr:MULTISPECIES: hypothetical protein [Microbacterium]KJL41020.1 hypothetical protein RS82_02935 [Microbacterium trichothecenolyticum]MDR7188890.1 hypothetical protein [Microbacterium sp. BE35]
MSTPETPDAAPTADATTPVADARAGERDTADTAVAIDLTPPAPSPLPPAFDPFVASASAPEPAAVAAEPATPPATAVAPRVRWAGIVWGLVLAVIAAFAVWVLTDAARQAAVTAWLVNLTPAAAVAYVVLFLGGFALIAGIVGLARRAQRVVERRRTPDPA